MARKNKKGNQEQTVKSLLLVTSILNLIKSLIDLLNKLLD